MELLATGTQPIAVARTNGSHDATDAIGAVARTCLYVTVTSSAPHCARVVGGGEFTACGGRRRWTRATRCCTRKVLYVHRRTA